MLTVMARRHPLTMVLCLLAAAPPAVIECLYLTQGPGLHTPRTAFVAAFLVLIVLATIGGGLLPWRHGRLASMTVALSGILALGTASRLDLGVSLLVAAIPVGVALLHLWRRVPAREGYLVVLAAMGATFITFSLGMELTGMLWLPE